MRHIKKKPNAISWSSIILSNPALRACFTATWRERKHKLSKKNKLRLCISVPARTRWSVCCSWCSDDTQCFSASPASLLPACHTASPGLNAYTQKVILTNTEYVNQHHSTVVGYALISRINSNKNNSVACSKLLIKLVLHLNRQQKSLK